MSVVGRKRRITDEQAKRIREWVSLSSLCRSMGISPHIVSHIRKGYQHKKPLP